MSLSVVAFALFPAAARAASQGHTPCLTATVAATTGTANPDGAVPLYVTARTVQSATHHVDRLHLQLSVQEELTPTWEPVATPLERRTFATAIGVRDARTWTLREDGSLIENEQRDGFPTRVSAVFGGICKGRPFSLPLTIPLGPPIADPHFQPAEPQYVSIALPDGSHQPVEAHTLLARISNRATVASFGSAIHLTDFGGVYTITVPGDLLQAAAAIQQLPGVVWVTTVGQVEA